jgi:DNA polymerase (family 10)
MPIRNTDIADVFDTIADCLDIEGENAFKIRAYRSAARTVRGLGRELKDMLAAGEDPTALAGIGRELAAKIAEILETGTARALEHLKEKVPPGVIEMLRVPGLGPKRVGALFHDLGIQSLSELKAAAEDGRVRALPGFGARTEKQIIKAVDAMARRGSRVGIAAAAVLAERLAAQLKKTPGVVSLEAAGSFRRRKETVGDLDLLVAAGEGSGVMDVLVNMEEVDRVLARGSTTLSVVLRSGLRVDLRRVEEPSFGAALQHFTGSQAHNEALRGIGRRLGLKVNEYGVFDGERRIAGETEESVYRALGLPWIAPELREDRGEIEAARQNRLPELVTLSDLRGELHSHTTDTDGRDRLADMAMAARRRGLSYLAVTDHSRFLRMVDGLDERRLMAQMEEIDRMNAGLEGITMLKGIEVEILEDGRLDLPASVLKRLDLVIGSIHNRFQLSAQRQTERILRAMDQPCFTILGHPSGRLIGERDPYEADMEAVIRKAAERGCFLELNANPQRLDLDDIYCRMAKEAGVLVAVDSDAHGVEEFDQLVFGIGQARRGWLEKKDVLNTRPIAELRALLKRTMG